AARDESAGDLQGPAGRRREGFPGRHHQGQVAARVRADDLARRRAPSHARLVPERKPLRCPRLAARERSCCYFAPKCDFTSVPQLTTTTIDATGPDPSGDISLIMRKRWPSGDTSYDRRSKPRVDDPAWYFVLRIAFGTPAWIPEPVVWIETDDS